MYSLAVVAVQAGAARTISEAMDAPFNDIIYGVSAWRIWKGDTSVRDPEESAAMAAHLERMAHL